MMRGGCQYTDAEFYAIQSIRIRIVAAAVILFSIADQSAVLLFADILRLFAGDHCLIVLFNGINDGIRINGNNILQFVVEQILQLVRSAYILAEILILVLIRIRPRNLCSFIGNFDEYALLAVIFNAVFEFVQGQYIPLAGFIHKSLSGGRIDVDCVVAAAEGKISVVNPADRHQLCEAHAGGCRSDSLRHLNAVADL